MDITVNEITKVYGTAENRVTALKPASMEIHKGDFISIMGPSGSGKSTLLHIISGLDSPTAGMVTYGWTRCARMKDTSCRVPDFWGFRTVCPIFLTSSQEASSSVWPSHEP